MVGVIGSVEVVCIAAEESLPLGSRIQFILGSSRRLIGAYTVRDIVTKDQSPQTLTPVALGP